MAVDSIRHRGRVIDADFAKESRADSLLALARGIDEILDSFFVAGRSWEPPCVVAWIRWSKCRFVLYVRGGHPALHAASDVCDFSGHSLGSFSESGPAPPGPSRGGLALRISGRRFRLVLALASRL